MSETLIEIPGRDYSLSVAITIDGKGNRENFMDDKAKIIDSIVAAIEQMIEKTNVE
jgi:hypothetical protein